jgi:ATP-dependent Clp protease ATP-binding subunit ClpC
MFERFSEQLRIAMGIANDEAHRLNHEYIGTEHVLLGLVEGESCLPALVLRHMNIDPRRVRSDVECLVKPGPTPVATDRLPQTPRTKKAIELAIQEARRCDHKYVGTGHMLLGLIQERDGIAALVLIGLGAATEPVRAALAEVLSQGDPEREPAGTSVVPPSPSTQIERLRARVEQLEEEVRQLRQRLGEGR